MLAWCFPSILVFRSSPSALLQGENTYTKTRNILGVKYLIFFFIYTCPRAEGGGENACDSRLSSTPQILLPRKVGDTDNFYGR